MEKYERTSCQGQYHFAQKGQMFRLILKYPLITGTEKYMVFWEYLLTTGTLQCIHEPKSKHYCVDQITSGFATLSKVIVESIRSN